MNHIQIPSNQGRFDQIETYVPQNGLIIIASTNQNKALWASYEALNVLHRRCSGRDRNEYVVTIGGPDQYTDQDKFRPVEIEDLTSNMIVYAGAIRSAEKANLLLKAASICPVVAIMHSPTFNLTIERLEEMGIDSKELKPVLKVILDFDS
jgi:hypothetical protein